MNVVASDMVLVRVQATPNPQALKFVTNRTIKSQGKVTFEKPSDAVDVKLAEELFLLEGVRQLHFFENVITVTFAEDTDADTLQLEVQAVLQTRLPMHNPDFVLANEKRPVDRSHLSEQLQQIEKILDETVRMFLQGDGGDIEVVGLTGKILEVRYQGACGTCPSSVGATLDAIQGVLREQFDPEIEVVPL